MTSISVKNLSFSYNKNQTILNDISIDFVSRKVNLLLGLNGCGKTTLIKLLAGLLKTKKGKITYDGIDLNKIKCKERSKIFSYVPQYTSYISDFSVREYLSFSLNNEVAVGRKPSNEQIRRTFDYAEKLHITYLLDKMIGELSGGERQLVSICGSLIQNTEVIILDEPTSALDFKNQQLVLSSLKEIAEKDGKTIIMSAHNPNFASYLDANTILINDGCIYKCGNSKEIINLVELTTIYGKNICYSKDLDYEEISIK